MKSDTKNDPQVQFLRIAKVTWSQLSGACIDINEISKWHVGYFLMLSMRDHLDKKKSFLQSYDSSEITAGPNLALPFLGTQNGIFIFLLYMFLCGKMYQKIPSISYANFVCVNACSKKLWLAILESYFSVVFANFSILNKANFYVDYIYTIILLHTFT